jgi:hypothetical protein
MRLVTSKPYGLQGSPNAGGPPLLLQAGAHLSLSHRCLFWTDQ